MRTSSSGVLARDSGWALVTGLEKALVMGLGLAWARGLGLAWAKGWGTVWAACKHTQSGFRAHHIIIRGCPHTTGTTMRVGSQVL